MTEETEIDNPWFIDEGMPGSGPRPSWLPDKFRSVADLSKSYSELEKRVGVAPDKYDFSKSKYLDPDYVPFQELQEIAREKRVPQEVMDKMLDSFDRYMDEFTPNDEDEIKKLGDNAKERVMKIDNWAKANLSRDGYEALVASAKSASSIIALEELRGKMMSEVTQVPGNNGQISEQVSVDELKAELASNMQKYSTDENIALTGRKDLKLLQRTQPVLLTRLAVRRDNDIYLAMKDNHGMQGEPVNGPLTGTIPIVVMALRLIVSYFH